MLIANKATRARQCSPPHEPAAHAELTCGVAKRPSGPSRGHRAPRTSGLGGHGSQKASSAQKPAPKPSSLNWAGPASAANDRHTRHGRLTAPSGQLGQLSPDDGRARGEPAGPLDSVVGRCGMAWAGDRRPPTHSPPGGAVAGAAPRATFAVLSALPLLTGSCIVGPYRMAAGQGRRSRRRQPP